MNQRICPNCRIFHVDADRCNQCHGELIGVPTATGSAPESEHATGSSSTAAAPSLDDPADPRPQEVSVDSVQHAGPGHNGSPCGHEVVAGARFCPQCGEPQMADADNDAAIYVVNERTGERHRLGPGEHRIGQADEASVPITDDPYTSRDHLHVQVRADEAGHVVAEDSGSSNGTLLFLQGRAELKPGDRLVVGKTVLRIEKATE